MKEEYLCWGRFPLSHLVLIRLLRIEVFFGVSEMLKSFKSNSQKTDLASKEINEKISKRE